MRSRPSCRPISGSLNGASYAAVWSIFSTRVHALTQPPNQPTTFVDSAKIMNIFELCKCFRIIRS